MHAPVKTLTVATPPKRTIVTYGTQPPGHRTWAQPADPAAVEAEERAARRTVRERKLAILEQLFWQTDFRREALARANAELGTPTTCEPSEPSVTLTLNLIHNPCNNP